jgi:hypothetical protein
VHSLVEASEAHLHKENAFIHPAMEARQPGSAALTLEDHEHHEAAFARLHGLANAVEHGAQGERGRAAMRLYHELALFVADNLQHMHMEETHNNRVLWDAYNDEELLAVEHAIVASIPPEQKSLFMRWMVPSASPEERLQLLRGVRQGAPAEAFEGLLAMLRPLLADRDWTRLAAALA